MGTATAERQKREVIRRYQEQRYITYEAAHAHEKQSFVEKAPYKAAAEYIDYEAIIQRAVALIEAHQGKEKAELKQEYHDNAATAIFEAITASGHLSEIRITGTPDEVNQQVLDRLLNGYDLSLPTHELKRRFQEIVEELVWQETQMQILTGFLPPDTLIITESPYVTGMSDEMARSLGYRSYNKKGMNRSTSLDLQKNGTVLSQDGTITRGIDQISYSNSSAEEVVERRAQEGIAIPLGDKPDVAVLGNHLVTTLHDMPEGIIDFQRRVDTFKGANVRFGEIPDETTPTYENLRRVSKEREAVMGQFVDRLAKCEELLDQRLAAREINRALWSKLYMKELHDIVQEICVFRPEYTEVAFGKDVVEDYQKAHELMLAGDYGGAGGIVDNASSREQSMVICGDEYKSEQPSNAEESTTTQRLRMTKEQWVWVEGYCRTKHCAGNVKKTKVGPCDVCVTCQDHYDNKRDPETEYKRQKLQAAKQAAQDAKDSNKLEKRPPSPKLERIQRIDRLGGAEEVYRIKGTSKIGTKEDLAGKAVGYTFKAPA